MFTGIIETMGVVVKSTPNLANIDFWIQADFSKELTIDQSIAHNGVCLTVVEIDGDQYKVSAVKETLNLTNLSGLKPGDAVNLERGMLANARLDGHMVQGHVDGTAKCVQIASAEGSWGFQFTMQHADFKKLVIHKGSITVNGISLTIATKTDDSFSVAIIPYTFQHTNLKHIKVGDSVNVEFDLIGKYIANYMGLTVNS